MAGNLPLTVIILCFNEELNLAAALDSVVGWAHEVFVVDSYSTDRTVDVALARQEEGVHVVQHAFESYSEQWSWAVESLPIRTEWVLKLDADERTTPAFRNEVEARLLAAEAPEDAFIVHWRLVFLGRRLRWGGLYPNGAVRIWRHGRGRFDDRGVNEHVLVDGAVGEIRHAVDHEDRKGLGQWLDRHNRYSALEARALEAGNVTGGVAPRFFGSGEERRAWLRRVYYAVPARALGYFLYRYVVRLGFLDGRAGFRFAFLHASYFYWIDLKRDELRRTGALPEVIWPARGTPHPGLAPSPPRR